MIQLTQPSFSGPLLKVNADEEPFEIKSGAVVLVTGRDKRQMRQKALSLAAQGAAGAMAAFPEEPEHFEGVGERIA